MRSKLTPVVAEARSPLDEVVGAAGNDDPPLGRVDGATYAIDCLVEAADRLIGIARGVLDPDSGQTKRHGGLNGRGDVFRRVAVTVLDAISPRCGT